MNLKDTTKNQHFVAQVEQRFNAINPDAREENQRIYAFDLIDRESYKVKINPIGGVKISSSLSLGDLFSFDVLEGSADRYNFESLFQAYEEDIRNNTKSLMDKIATGEKDVKREVINIFASKLMNFVRNPYSIAKVLNTFPSLANVYPTDPVHWQNFLRILNGRKPHQKYLCEMLGVSEDDYKKWLSTIFLLLTPLESGKLNLFEQTIRNMYESPSSFVMIMIYTYKDKACLLSDRGYSTPLDGYGMAFDFNLCSNAFARYVFGDINKIAPRSIPRWRLDEFIGMPRDACLSHIKDDLCMLEKYNRNIVYQCFRRVFCSSTECYGL